MPITPGFISNANNAFGLSDPGAQTTVAYDPPVTTGTELGRAESAANYTITTALITVPGLYLPVTVPAGVNVFVECELPWVVMGATGTFIAFRILEDATQLRNTLVHIPANNYALLRVSCSYAPTPGLHTYLAQVQLGVASVGATVEGGLQSGSIVSPYLRVVTC